MDRCTPKRSRRMQSVAVAFLISVFTIGLAPSASQAANDASSIAKGIGIGTASALSSLIYGPAKILYATGGVVVGGLGWVFSGGDTEVAKTVMTPAVYGDYVISPGVLTGDEKLEWYGRSPEYPETSHVSAAAPDDW